jgi:hypothetical protein
MLMRKASERTRQIHTGTDRKSVQDDSSIQQLQKIFFFLVTMETKYYLTSFSCQALILVTGNI